MRKTDKKREKQLVNLLNDVCEQALEDIDGFSWLTHMVNYQRFPDSLIIICVFSNREKMLTAQHHENDKYLMELISQTLKAEAIELKKPNKQVRFDNEEDCEQQHAGNWQLRLQAKL